MSVTDRQWRLAPLFLGIALARCTCTSEPEPMTLLEVQPARGRSDQATPITIVGSGFSPLVVIDYQSGRQSAIGLQFTAWLGPHPLEQLTYVDSQHLAAVVPAGLPVGTFGLTVESPQEQRSELADAFTVIPGAIVDGGFEDAFGTDRLGRDTLDLDARRPDALLDRPGTDLSLERPSGDSLTDRADPDTVQPDTAQPDTAQPDTAQPDTAQPDIARPDTAQPDTAQPDTATCTRTPTWWDAAYGYRLPLTVSETISGSLLAGYSVAVVVDTAALIRGGRLRSSGDDLRVVRTVGTSHQELDRHVVNFNRATTQIWFKTQADIGGSDTSYLLYYGNSAAGVPPAHWADSMGADTPSAVYLAADDFEGHATGTRPNGWVGAGDYTVQSDSGSQVLRVVGAGGGTADYFFAGDYAWTDVAVRGQIKVSTWGGAMYYGLFTRVESTSPFDALWWGFYDNNTLQLYTLTLSDPNAQALSGSACSWGCSGGEGDFSPNAGTNWHTLETTLAGRSSTHYYDGVQKTTYTIPTGNMLSGRMGLCSGYSVSLAYWDDIVVRRYVSPEPSVTLGSEEPVCP